MNQTFARRVIGQARSLIGMSLWLEIRRLDVTWTEDQTREYDLLAKMARRARKTPQDFIKEILREQVK